MTIQLLLKQHVGGPCAPVVKVGDRVDRGQRVAEPTGLGAYIHASLSGVVEKITDTAIFIEADDDQPEQFVPIEETEDKLEAIRLAGVVGAGGAGFPTHVKLKTDLSGGVVIANAAECEPVLEHNIHFIEEDPDKLLRGIRYMMDITGAEKGIVTIKKKHREAILKLHKAAKEHQGIELFFLPDMYPAGDERVIVREVTGIELQPGQLPLEAKCVISNVETIKRCVEAIEERKPFISKDLTVAGRVLNAQKGRVFMDVPLGEPVKKYIDLCGGIVEPFGEIVLGGPFTGKHGEEDAPVTKMLGGIFVSMPFPEEHAKVGLLCCECGAQEARLREIAEKMKADVVAVENCKRMSEDKNGRLRCELPGVCPGQAEKVLLMKKKGMQAIIAGSCGD